MINNRNIMKINDNNNHNDHMNNKDIKRNDISKNYDNNIYFSHVRSLGSPLQTETKRR